MSTFFCAKFLCKIGANPCYKKTPCFLQTDILLYCSDCPEKTNGRMCLAPTLLLENILNQILFCFYRFINARRRILQPMLDASNPEGPKAKKSKIQSRPAQRFWPENLVPSQFNTIPIAPAPVTVQAVMQGAVQMQQVPPGTAVAVAPGTALPTTITIPNVQGTTVIPGTVTLQQQQQQTGTPSTVVVVTLPPSGSHISTVTAAESSSVDTTRQTIIAPVVSSHVESVAVSSLSPMYSNIQQGSPSLQNSPLPTMVQNGSMGGREGNLVGSPHHIPVSSVSMSGVQDNLVGVTAISLENAAVSRSRVN